MTSSSHRKYTSVRRDKIYRRTNGKLKAIQPRRHHATRRYSALNQHTRAPERAIEEDPDVRQLTFNYFRPIWLGLYGHLSGYSISNSEVVFSRRPDTMVFPGHCGSPALCRSSRDRWQWFRFVNPIYGSSARNPDRKRAKGEMDHIGS